MIDALTMLFDAYGVTGVVAILAFRQEQIHRRQLKILRRLEGIEGKTKTGQDGGRCKTLRQLMRQNDD